MRKSGYRTIFHIYMIFFLSLLWAAIAIFIIFLMLVTVRTPAGETVRSNWPKLFTESLGEQIIFINGRPQINQSGIEQLRKNQIGLQILDNTGHEVYAFQKTGNVSGYYSATDLLHLYQTGHPDTDEITSFVGEITYQGNDYAYIVHFPMEIRKITMYLNGEHFTGGKTVIFRAVGVLFLVVIAAGIIYGFWTAKVISRLTASIQDISKGHYIPLKRQGAFSDLYNSLNDLDSKIKAGDQLREKTETMRKEWIANITHDLKTPLSPIKGYAEILQTDTAQTEEQRKRYAGVMLKNAAYMENLIDDLKLTYQLENGILPVNRKDQNLVRFLRELVIDVLNRPEYENRRIQFDSTEKTISFPFDDKLFTRAVQNIIVNAFVHGDEKTEITIQISVPVKGVQICIADNGKGMTAEETDRLFERYYRGTNTENKPEGTGLGLAIAKNIVELHNGTISVSSIPGVETTFIIVFPLN